MSDTFDINAGIPPDTSGGVDRTPKPQRISTPEEAARLSPGTSFIGPDDKERVVPFHVERPDQIAHLPDGADFVGPDGKLRQKPRYEGIDFTPQALYDIAHSDKGRRMALEKFYPGKVRDDPSGGFFIEDDNGKLLKPGRGVSKYTGAVAADAIPTVLAGAGGLLGGAAGTVMEPGVGTVLGGAAGGYGGGYAGQRINDIFSQLAGVYDPEGGEENARMAGYMGAAGELGGRALSAAAPTVKEGAQFVSQNAAKAAGKFLGVNAAKLETGLPIAEAGEQPGTGLLGKLGLSKPGTAVSPSAMFESAPHLTNVAEILQQKFDRSDTYLANAERFMDKRAKDILAHKDIGALVEDSLVRPKAAVSTEEAGSLLKQSAQLRAVNESAEADRRLQAALANRRAEVEAKHKPDIEAHRARNESVVATAEQAKKAADNLVQEGFQAIERQANDAIRVAQVGHNAGDLWRTVAESFVGLRRSIAQRATSMYDNANAASNGLVPPGSEALAGRAQGLLDQLPEGFAASHPTIVRRIAAMAGEVGENGEVIRPPTAATWSELHELRTMIRQDIKWNDLTSDVKNGALKFMEHGIDNALHGIEGSHPTIASAATKYKDKVYTGAIHPDAVVKLAEEMGVDVGTDEKFSEFYTKHYQDLIEGFLTSEGKFVSRTEAGDIAERAAQYKLGRSDRKLDALDIEMSGKEKSSSRFTPVDESIVIGRSPKASPVSPLKEASRLLKLADDFYRENMGPLNNQQIKSLVKALNSGLQADPKALLKVAIRDGSTEVANTIRNTVGPQTWDAMRAADVQEMLAQSRQLDGSLDGMKFAKQVEDRYQNGVLGVLHGEQGSSRLQKQALHIMQLKGKLPITPRPGDTANDIILRARSAAADAENLGRTDPIKALNNEMKKVEAAVRKEMAATRKHDQLAFLNESTVGANEAVNRILKDPDLIVAASRAFPGGEKSPEFQLMRQIWAQRFLSEDIAPHDKLPGVTKEIQELMFPGVTLDDMHMLAKEMRLLLSGATMRGGDFGGSLMAQSKVENPNLAKGTESLNWTKLIPGHAFVERNLLTHYYNTVRSVLTSPSTLRWLRKGLNSRDPVAKETARAELRAALQRGGAMGASASESVYQSTGPQ